MTADTDLLRRYVENGDESAFAELVRQTLPVIYSAALRRLNGNPHLAEEAAQAVFTQLACKAPSLTRHPALLGWLYVSTRFAANVIGRREQRRLNLERAAPMPNEPTHHPDWNALRPLLDQALDQLGERDREVIVLRFLANRSHAEIGGELNVSEDAARKRVDRALDRLRSVLVSRGITTSAGALAYTLITAPVSAVPDSLAAQMASLATTTAASSAVATGSTAAGVHGAIKVFAFAATALAVSTPLFVGAGLVVWTIQQSHDRAQLTAYQSTMVSLGSRLATLSKSRPQTAAALTSSAASSNAGAAANPDPTLALRIENLRLWQKMSLDPEFAKIREREFRIRAQHDFGTFLASRHYSPEKNAFLRAALAAAYDAEERMDMEAQLAGLTSAVDRNATQAKLQSEKQKFLDQLKPMFSEAEIDDIRRCYEARQVYGEAKAVSRDMSFAGVTLTPDQELALAMVICDGYASAWKRTADEQKRLREVDFQTGLSGNNRLLLEQAGAFLTPEQRQALEDSLRIDNQRRDVARRIRAAVAAELTAKP